MEKLSSEQLKNFIVFEAIDGGGKDTQAELLADELVRRGYNVVLTYEPSKETGILGRTIREMLQGRPDMPPKSLQLLILADRVLHVDQVRNLLTAGIVVISVRYMYSNVVYGQAGGLTKQWMVSANADFPRPEVVFYLDLPVDAALERMRKRGQEEERFENTDYLTKVRSYYQQLTAEYPEMVTIDASGSIEEVYDLVLNQVDKIGSWPALALGVDASGRCL